MSNHKHIHGHKRPVFSFLLIASGFCGISYEILYGRMLGDIIGDQFTVNASILLTFLLGIGIGTLFAHKLWQHLWILEGGIGLYGLLFALNLDAIDRMLYSGMLFNGANLALSLMICIGLVTVPAFLIGTSLPLFAGYAKRVNHNLKFSFNYALYNLGAAATVLLIEFFLLRHLGLRMTVICIAMLNVSIAFTLIKYYPTLRSVHLHTPESSLSILPINHWLALALASIASAIFQLLMLKIGECIFGPFRETFALVLCQILLGIALGSFVLNSIPRIRFNHLLMLNLASLVGIMVGFPWIAEAYAHFYPAASQHHLSLVLLKFLTSGTLMLIPAITFGATIPALLRSHHNISRSSGSLLFVSSIANAFGFFIMVLFLHKFFDYGTLLLIVASLSLIALLTFYAQVSKSLFIGLTLFLFTVIAHQHRWNEDLLYLGYTAFHDVDELQEDLADFDYSERFKGPQDVFSITWSDDAPYFFINGYNSIPLNAPSEKIVGALSTIFSPRSDQALVLGVGSGATASVVGMLFEETDAIEINKVVLDNLFRMSDYNFDIESNASVRLYHDDAIHFIKSGRTQYSMIVNTVTTPLYFSSSKLYTQDFLKSVKKRLKPDGIYVTWVDSRVGNRGIDIILNTIQSTFNASAICAISSSYFLVICSDETIHAHQPNAIAQHAFLSDYFFDHYGIMPEWLKYSLLTSNARKLLTDPQAPLNTLDRPTLEFEMAQLRRRGYRQFQKNIQANLDLEESQAISGFGGDWNAFHLLSHNYERLGRNSIFSKQWKQLIQKQTSDFIPRLTEAQLQYTQREVKDLPIATQYHKIGSAYLKEDLYDQAIQALNTALQHDPNHDNTHFNLGACYEYKGDYLQAIEHYEAELRVDPDDTSVHYRIGRVFTKSNQYDEAIETLSMAIGSSPTANTYYYLARAFEGRGDLENAYKHYMITFQKDDEHMKALQSISRIRQKIMPNTKGL